MAETYKLTDPSGTEVEVTTAARRDVLLKRGYKEGSSSKKSQSDSKKSTTKKQSGK